MVRWKVASLIGEHLKETSHLIQHKEIAKATGLSANTVGTIVRGGQLRVDLRTLDRLLAYFSGKLGRQMTAADLLEWVPDGEGEKA